MKPQENWICNIKEKIENLFRGGKSVIELC